MGEVDEFLLTTNDKLEDMGDKKWLIPTGDFFLDTRQAMSAF